MFAEFSAEYFQKALSGNMVGFTLSEVFSDFTLRYSEIISLEMEFYSRSHILWNRQDFIEVGIATRSMTIFLFVFLYMSV